jgi:hypothetical protein
MITAFKASAGTGRQDVSAKKISIALKDVSLKNALNKISDLADISFVYVNSQVLDNSKVSITAHNEQVGVLLKKLLTPHSFSYTVVDDRIIIRHEADKVSQSVLEDVPLVWDDAYNFITRLLAFRGL